MSRSEDSEFRKQLAARIARYGDMREEVQRQLMELNHQLRDTEQRLEAALEMYRLEFGEEPPVAGVVSVQTSLLSEGQDLSGQRRRVRSGGPSWNDAVVTTLKEAGEPLHLKELWDRMKAAGFETEAQDPLRSLAAILVRHPEAKRTAPNTYGLSAWDTSEEPETAPPTPDGDTAAVSRSQRTHEEDIAWST
jgi:hypothetical protein